jgi:hypothetical protein
MGGDTMSKYDEKAKNRIARCLQKNYEQVRLTVPKGTLAKYKAFAAAKGISMTEMIKQLVQADMDARGFEYEDSADE